MGSARPRQDPPQLLGVFSLANEDLMFRASSQRPTLDKSRYRGLMVQDAASELCWASYHLAYDTSRICVAHRCHSRFRFAAGCLTFGNCGLHSPNQRSEKDFTCFGASIAYAWGHS